MENLIIIKNKLEKIYVNFQMYSISTQMNWFKNLLKNKLNYLKILKNNLFKKMMTKKNNRQKKKQYLKMNKNLII